MGSVNDAPVGPDLILGRLGLGAGLPGIRSSAVKGPLQEPIQIHQDLLKQHSRGCKRLL